MKEEKWKDSKRSGFTIIEVVLVLAIAGLIFMMVFVALPALQSSQRNTQRRDDLSRVATAIINYQGNNHGRTPWANGLDINKDGTRVVTNFIKRYVDHDASDGFSVPMKFDEYNVATACSEQFMDPDGTCYGVYYLPMNASKENPELDLTDAIYQNNDGKLDHIIYAVVNSYCAGPEGVVAYKAGNNNTALLYVLEGGSIICADNV